MKIRAKHNKFWQLVLLVSGVITTHLIYTTAIKAQLIPDDTLGTENSQINSLNEFIDLIEGGAIRDINLFHSFLEFNVGEGRGVYFANPEGILNIITRVTGGNPSNIFGVLGVDGAANLFLLNPNGIVFGEGGSLDVNGSFVGTTADAISFGEQGFFSATDPANSSLLSIQPGALFFNQLANSSATIVNRGSLAVGQDLTLAAGNLDLQGELFAGGNLTLQALDTVTIRDSVTNSFIAAAGNQLLIQGNQLVDIFALNSPESGLFAGGDLVLRSANQVGGDAHFWSGGSFRVEGLDGSLGNLFSPNDPVIRALGDVSFDSYIGASLHIIAGGSVNVSNIFIDTTETGTESYDFIQETVTLSDGTDIFIDGSDQPTVDIRAGVDPNQIGVPGITGQDFADIFFNLETLTDEPPVVTNNPTGADINIGNVVINPPNGVILLTNQYEPNYSLVRGNITINGNFQRGISTTGQEGDTTSVYIDSQGDIIIADSVAINSASNTGAGGDITLIAEGNILLNSLSSLSTSSQVGNGGNIKLIAEDISLNFFTFVDASNGGDIRIQSNRLLMDNFSFIFSVPTVSFSQVTADKGDIFIQATEAITIDGGTIGTLIFPNVPTNGGDIFIETGELTIIGAALEPGDLNPTGFLTGGDITSDTGGTGDAGDISINARQVRVLNGGQIRANITRLNDTVVTGNAGDITIRASDFIEVSGISEVDGAISKIATQVNFGTEGNGGDLLIETNRLIVSNPAQIQAGTFGAGQGGNLTINATQSIDITTDIEGDATGLFTGPERSNASGNGGDLTVRTGFLNLQGIGARISNEVDAEATGNAGNTLIEADQINISNGARITTGSFGTGNGGTLTINASESINLFGTDGQLEDEEPSGIFTATFGLGNAGNLIIKTGSLSIRDGATITASTLGLETGRAGNITIEASEFVEVTGTSVNSSLSSSIVSETGRVFFLPNPLSTGLGGDISLETGQLIVSDGAQISSSAFGLEDAGNLTIKASEFVQLFDGFLRTRTTNFGDAGDLEIATGQLLISGDSEVGASTRGQGRGGDIRINAADSVEMIGRGGLGTVSLLGGIPGNTIITTDKLIIRDGSQLLTSGLSLLGGGGDIHINAADSVEVIGGRFAPGSEFNSLLEEFGSNSEFFDPDEEIFLSSVIGTSAISPVDNPSGDLTIQTNRLLVRDGGQILTNTLGVGSGGRLEIIASEVIEISGTSPDGEVVSELSAQTNNVGDAGEIEIQARDLFIQDGGRISALSEGTGEAGDLSLNLQGVLNATDGSITTSSTQSSGGAINISAQNILLRGDSDITTNVNSGAGGGGNITLNADSILAFDDSDILAFAQDGIGGNITLNTPAFFGENFTLDSLIANPENNNLDDNNRVDINATGAVSGIVSIPDVSFIQNSLSDLQRDTINTDALLSNSCINRTGEAEGNFNITGRGNLPLRPGDASSLGFPTGTIRTIPNETSAPRRWQMGDPIVEPQGVYQLPNGKLVLSRECD